MPQKFASWLLCIHNIPPKPGYLRAKAAKRLSDLGAVALKNAVYCLPESPAHMEGLTWLAKEIGDGGGRAFVCRADFAAGLDDAQVRAMFVEAADVRYDAVAEAVRAELAVLEETDDMDAGRKTLARLRKDFDVARALDFFGAPGRERVGGLLSALEEWLRRVEGGRPEQAQRSDSPEHYRGRTWVTRAGVHVDRMASAWLIRRFVDPDARFRFVASDREPERKGEVRFDMLKAEFTHEGERCTFEVLVSRLGLVDAALTAVAEVIHDIDLKDDAYGRPEAAGVAALLNAIALADIADEARMERAFPILDGILAHFGANA